jgi:hypothetical protein
MDIPRNIITYFLQGRACAHHEGDKMTSFLEERFGRIPKAQSRSGLSKGSIYNLGRRHPGLLKKYGKATLVDLVMLDAIMGELPAAKLAAAADDPDVAI